MTKNSRPSAGIIALGVFCMTVLTGIGGTSAVALWEQRSTATMTVRAATSVPVPSPTPTPIPSNQPAGLTLLCTDPGNNTVGIGITGAGSPAGLSIAAKVVGGSYGASFPLAPTATHVDLTPLSPVLLTAGAANRNVVIKVTAVSASGTTTFGEYDHLKITGAGTKLNCS
ncbi:hypothetical protein BIU82_07020 [Arthrobacter sp. SW1]|uniref:hypothetical protein n=1 Tax=Arthrobacter sp. SW1 TaxID=1920889 RepID=UPI000877E93F|nr:hypothetical protein [Arthrobacter sp. SW1]OFI37625.1 hypothetical protein BIU82_07020 [Arthrobacter sp. SW1]